MRRKSAGIRWGRFAEVDRAVDVAFLALWRKGVTFWRWGIYWRYGGWDCPRDAVMEVPARAESRKLRRRRQGDAGTRSLATGAALGAARYSTGRIRRLSACTGRPENYEHIYTIMSWLSIGRQRNFLSNDRLVVGTVAGYMAANPSGSWGCNAIRNRRSLTAG